MNHFRKNQTVIITSSLSKANRMRPAGVKPATFGFEARQQKNTTIDRQNTYKKRRKHLGVLLGVFIPKKPDLALAVSLSSGVVNSRKRMTIAPNMTKTSTIRH